MDLNPWFREDMYQNDRFGRRYGHPGQHERHGQPHHEGTKYLPSTYFQHNNAPERYRYNNLPPHFTLCTHPLPSSEALNDMVDYMIEILGVLICK